MNAEDLLYSPVGVQDTGYIERMWDFFLQTIPGEIDIDSFSQEDLQAIKARLVDVLRDKGYPAVNSTKELEEVLY